MSRTLKKILKFILIAISILIAGIIALIIILAILCSLIFHDLGIKESDVREQIAIESSALDAYKPIIDYVEEYKIKNNKYPDELPQKHKDISITNVNKADLILRFDLQVDNEGNIIENSSKNMYITIIDDFGNNKKGIKVNNQFVEDNRIEIITTEEGDDVLSANSINQLRENIAGWLHTNGFESVQSVLDSNNETDINNLIAQFTHCFTI